MANYAVDKLLLVTAKLFAFCQQLPRPLKIIKKRQKKSVSFFSISILREEGSIDCCCFLALATGKGKLRE